jgi:hypothetical protein
MAKVYYATNRYPGDGATSLFTVAFVGGYLDKAHVKAFITDASGTQTPLTITAGMWVTASSINIGTPVAVGSTLTIYRDTPKTGPLVDYTNGTRLTEANLDLANKQSVFIGAELSDLFDLSGVEDAVAAAKEEVQELVDTAADSASAAAASASGAASSAGAAAGFATDAEAAALLAAASKTASEAAAANANISAGAAAASYSDTAILAAEIQLSGVGFDSAAYDFGFVSDPNEYFSRDFGTLA